MRALRVVALLTLLSPVALSAHAAEAAWKGLQPNPRLCDGKPLLPVAAAASGDPPLMRVIVKPDTKLYATPSCGKKQESCIARATLGPRSLVAVAGTCKDRLLALSEATGTGGPFQAQWINLSAVSRYIREDPPPVDRDWLGIWTNATSEHRRRSAGNADYPFRLRIEPYGDKLLVSVLLVGDITYRDSGKPVTSVVNLFSGRPTDKAPALLTPDAAPLPGHFPCTFTAQMIDRHLFVATDGLSCYRYGGIYALISRDSIPRR